MVGDGSQGENEGVDVKGRRWEVGIGNGINFEEGGLYVWK